MILRFLFVWVGLCADTPAAAPRFTINGRPIMGSFAVTWEPQDVRQALDIGINLFYCYDRRAGGRLLDVHSKMGAMIRHAGAKVMYNLCWAPAGYSLKTDVTPEQTEIELARPVAIHNPGVFWMGDEAVRFRECVNGKLVGCERGARGADPAPHRRGEFIVREETLRQAVLATKDSPNLWGYWIIDDRKGDQRHAVRNVYRLIKQWDVDAEGKPLGHVAVAGMASVRAMENFDAGACDMIGIYIYPNRRGSYHRDETAELLGKILAIRGQRRPATPFMGIFQAFAGPRYHPKPTPSQMRKQVLEFAQAGASALMAYSWRMVPDKATGKERGALRNLDDLREELARIIRDLNAGRIRLQASRSASGPATR